MLASALFIKAQNVYIPDADFKSQLVGNSFINTNHDAEIQESEALAVTDLTVVVGVGTISEITGIRSFKNLQRLYFQPVYQMDGGLENINLDGLEHLKYLQLDDDTALKKLSVNGCIALDSLLLMQNVNRAWPDPSVPFYLGTGLLDSLDLRSCINLTYLECHYQNHLRTLLIEPCINLKTIRLDMLSVANPLDFSRMTKLEEINMGFVSGNESPPINFDLHGFTHLRQFNIGPFYDNMLNLNLAGCISLEELYIYGLYNLQQTELDLSSSINLKRLSISVVNGLNKINIKNGSSLSYFSCAALVNFICADEGEIGDILGYFASHPQNVTVNSYCNFFEGGNYNTIKGNIKVGNANNGCNSTGSPVQELPLKIVDDAGNTTIRLSSTAGGYNYYSGKGNFTITPYFAYPYFSINPSSANVSFDTANSLTSIKNFCVEPVGIHNDVSITFLQASAPRPGFDTYYALVYKNQGTTTLSGNVAVDFDNSRMNFVSASENAAVQNAGQLTWNYNNLRPFERRTIIVTFNLLPPPVNNIGDTIKYLSAVTPFSNDETVFDNSFILPQRLRASYDPNDKQCLEGSKLDISKIGDYLHYQIRFQNEGTDTAFNIVVADTLSDKLDWNTFEFTGSSHTCDPILKNNKAEFVFENIQLPYKAINEPASHGWVAFKIKPKPSVVIGDSLKNSAAIYFDFNMPVITNMATTIVSSSSTPVPVKLEYFSVNQKNNTNILHWKAGCTYGNASFVMERSDDGIHFKGIGNISATALRCQLPFNFTDNDPVAGKNYYRLKISDADGTNFYSKTLVAGNNKAGIEITAVASNTAYINSNKQQTIQMKVIAADGKEIAAQKQTVAGGGNNIVLQMKNAAKGIYTLIIYTTEGETITKRFIK